jgi:glycosyltransferase involved in cell wall biosynthesis
MHVAISGMFWDQPTVGSGQYLRGLLAALPPLAPDWRFTLLTPAYWKVEGRRQRVEGRGPDANQPQDLSESANTQRATRNAQRITSQVVQTPFDAVSRRLSKLWFEQVALPAAAARIGANLLHVPYFAPPLAATLPVVTTILDLIPLLLPEYRGSPALRAYTSLASRAARRAARVITISDHSWGEVVVRLGISPERVTTTYLAPDSRLRPADPQLANAAAAHYGLQSPFVYYVGGLDARKNVGTLVAAFARMRHSGGPLATLVIAGRALGADRALFPDVDAQIAAADARAFVRRIEVPHADGPLLFAAAHAFAFPSRYEGFGLPPLEAMACGTPVAAADATSLPEVVGDAALLVPPDDIGAWAGALWRLLADEPLRAELRRRGLRRAAQFSYERTAQATLGVYRAAL